MNHSPSPLATLPVEIPSSKKKLVLSLGGAILFIVIGLWFIISPPVVRAGPVLRDPLFIRIIGAVAFLFFSLIAVYIVRKLSDKRPGVIIDEKGIWDNAGATAAGLVLWSDITGIRMDSFGKQKFILIGVKDQAQYINRQTSLLKKKSMQMGLKMYGTPVSISAAGLNCKPEELLATIQEQYAKNQVRHA